MFQKVSIKGIECENRAVRSATATWMCDDVNGYPTQECFDYYAQLAKGHPGLIITGHCYIDIRGKAHALQASIADDSTIQYHQRLVQAMRAANPNIKIGCQIMHCGRSAISENPFDINTASVEEIKDIIKKFADAAVRVEKAGYDCVQLHGGHTLFISQTISDYYNKRTDVYRASDFKVLREILAACKAAVSIPVGIKLQCDDFINGYLMTPEQAANIVATLDFDFVETTGGGLGKAKHMPHRNAKYTYYYKYIITLFRERNLLKKQPVICTGGFENIADAEEALDDGCAMVGFSRKWIRNPMFLLKDDKKCVRCSGCIGLLGKGVPLRCIINNPLKK